MKIIQDKKNRMIRGLVFAMFAALLGFLLTEAVGITGSRGEVLLAKSMGYPKLAAFIEKQMETSARETSLNDTYEAYCEKNKLNPDDDDSMVTWMNNEVDTAAKLVAECKKAEQAETNAQDDALQNEFANNSEALMDAYDKSARIAAYIWSAVIALLIGLFVALSETKNAGKVVLATLISGVMGFVSGLIAQSAYSNLMPEDSDDMFSLVVRGIGWSVIGLGVGLAIGIIRREKKEAITCVIAGFASAFISGAVFEIMVQIVTSNAMLARGIALLLMGALIGISLNLFRGEINQDYAQDAEEDFGEIKNP